MVKRAHDVSDSSLEDEATSALDSAASPPARKFSAADMEETSSPPPSSNLSANANANANAIQCSLPPHRQTVDFSTIEEFEVHYAKEHSHRCTSCGKNFPTAHFLALHIDEHHNPIREALQAKGEKTYACFVEGCERRCSTAQKRRLHLIDKHLFPKMYHFRIVDTGIDHSTSLLHEGRRRRVSTAAETRHRRREARIEGDPGSTAGTGTGTVVPGRAAAEPEPSKRRDRDENVAVGNLKSAMSVSDTVINDLATSMTALRFVPPSVANKQRNLLHGK